jgi:hypothetical protein
MPTVKTFEELADIEACKEAALRYCRGVDRLDPDEMRSAYWDDATDDHGNFVGNAWTFVDRCMVGHDRWAWTLHTTYNHVVELDDDGVHARGECYNIAHLGRPDDDKVDMWYGRYLDRYEKREDEWRIIERVCVHEGDRSAPADEPMVMTTEKFRQGSFDRRTPGRPIGP